MAIWAGDAVVRRSRPPSALREDRRPPAKRGGSNDVVRSRSSTPGCPRAACRGDRSPSTARPRLPVRVRLQCERGRPARPSECSRVRDCRSATPLRRCKVHPPFGARYALRLAKSRKDVSVSTETLLPWSINPLGVALELVGPEIHVAQVARRVTQRFVIEVVRAEVAALAAGGHRVRTDARAELD